MTEVSLDGGCTWQPAPLGVQVVVRDQFVPGEDELGWAILNLTHEGLITDVWVQRGDAEHNIATSSVLFSDMISDLVEADA